jgi:hypothetical protein
MPLQKVPTRRKTYKNKKKNTHTPVMSFLALISGLGKKGVGYIRSSSCHFWLVNVIILHKSNRYILFVSKKEKK